MIFGGTSSIHTQRIALLVPLFAIVLLFQNCGMEGDQETGLYVGSQFSNTKCLSEVVDCGASADYLQITLDMIDNQVHASSLANLNLTGRCNVGNFSDYYIDWQILQPDGSARASGNEFGVCVRGKYQFSVSIAGFPTNTNYTIKVRIIGRDDAGMLYENNSSNGAAYLDFSKL